MSSPPFDAAKYERLMSGLEVSEIALKEVKKDNDRFRIDAEYFRKVYLQNETYLKLTPFIKLKDSKVQIIHPAEINRTYVEKGVWFFRAQNLAAMDINDSSNKVYISFDDVALLSRNIINKGDILITRTGNVGDCSIYYMDEKAIASSHILIVRSKKINNYYLSVFLNTKYGRLQIEKGKYGSVQPEIAPHYLENIIVPDISGDFQLHIQNMVEKAENIRKQSTTLYTSACDLLLSELGLKDFEASNENISIKTLKESFLKSGRLDAEYYQEKYEDYRKIITCKSHTYVKDEYTLVKERPDFDKKEYNYIEIGDINISDGSYKAHVEKVQELPANAKIIPKAGDILISTVRPNRGAVSIIEKEEDLIVSGAFAVLRAKTNSKYKNEVLKLVFTSDIYKSWLMQFNVGTSYPIISDEDILNMPIPLIADDVQNEISSLIQKSISYCKEAKSLLRHCVGDVEREIEKRIEEHTELK